MTALKLTKIGNSTGVILPKEALNDMKLEAGDKIFLNKTADGGYQLSPYDAEFDRQMQAARRFMKKYRGALRELAK
jgi:putative addiction module antidote